jgi:hypothetical protein
MTLVVIFGPPCALGSASSCPAITAPCGKSAARPAQNGNGTRYFTPRYAAASPRPISASNNLFFTMTRGFRADVERAQRPSRLRKPNIEIRDSL